MDQFSRSGGLHSVQGFTEGLRRSLGKPWWGGSHSDPTVFGSRLAPRSALQPRQRGRTGAERPKNGPGLRQGNPSACPWRFVANWARVTHSWGTAAPRYAPSDAAWACHGPFMADFGANVRQSAETETKILQKSQYLRSKRPNYHSCSTQIPFMAVNVLKKTLKKRWL